MQNRMMTEAGGASAPANGQGGSALARAVTLHLDGKSREALRELERAIETGDSPREV
jgi:hypothetical protein